MSKKSIISEEESVNEEAAPPKIKEKPSPKKGHSEKKEVKKMNEIQQNHGILSITIPYQHQHESADKRADKSNIYKHKTMGNKLQLIKQSQASSVKRASTVKNKYAIENREAQFKTKSKSPPKEHKESSL